MQTETLPRQEALATGARHLFGEKHGEQVRVVTMGRSKELCGGAPRHATGQIGMGVPVQKTSIAVGMHRIEELTDRAAEDHLMHRHQTVESPATKLQASREMLQVLLVVLTEHQVQKVNAARRRLASPHREAAREEANRLALAPTTVSGIHVAAAQASASDDKTPRAMSAQVRARLGLGGVVLAALLGERVTSIVTVTPDLGNRGLSAGKLAAVDGHLQEDKSGGRLDSAQDDDDKDRNQLPAALNMGAFRTQKSLR